MKLRYSTSSPFVRKVTAVAIATGLDSKIERVMTNTADPKSNLAADNPLGKVPALTTDDGLNLVDSPLICEYLDSQHSGQKLFPAPGKARWLALRQQAIADGMMDAGVLCLMESRRPAGQVSDAALDKQKGKIKESIKALEGEVDALKGPVTIGQITVGCALGYVDFRMPDMGWRTSAPKLGAWFDEFQKNKFMADTQPKNPPLA